MTHMTDLHHHRDMLECAEATTARRSALSFGTSWAMTPVAAHSLVVFRISFGLLMAAWAFDYLRMDRIRLLCAPDAFHFTYSGFTWVKPWPGNGSVFQFAAMLLAALMIAAGAMYRFAAFVFAFGFTHFFLIDRTNYQNHYYLVVLLSWMMILLPANRLCALDAINGSVARSSTIPRWCLLLLQFHVALPYIFGGIAKIEADWLTGEPMRNMLLTQAWFVKTGAAADQKVYSLVLTWGGLLFDLLIVPAVLWSRTRIPAYLLAICFHVVNSILFQIHVFPWLMIAATTVFFSPDWPVWFAEASGTNSPTTATSPDSGDIEKSIQNRFRLSLLSMYCCFHILWPLRHLAYDGCTGWTERGHYFAWRMMLRGKTVGIRYSLTNPVTGETRDADIRSFLNHEQQIKFARDPEMILDLAHGLATAYQLRTGQHVEVRALVLASLNGRKPQLLIDPAVNLAAEPRGSHLRPWIVPLTEPLRKTAWNIPIDQWEKSIQIPTHTCLVQIHSGDPTSATSLLNPAKE